MFIGGDAGARDEGARGGEDLGFVTCGVRGRARGAAISDERAMRFGRIAFAQVALGDAVVAK